MASEARAEVEALLPHRAPFLFVDRMIERDAGRVVTEWDVRPELECFAGHYPGDPVLPGVLICEFVFQSGALLAGTGQAGIPVLTRVEDARFKRIVRPGERLRAEVRLEERLANARWMSASVRSQERLVMRLRFTLASAGAATAGGEP